MKIPKKLNILGHTYEIILQDRDKTGGTDDLGSTYAYKNKIFIHNQQHQTQQEASLLHEILHCINSILSLDLKENQIRALEGGLYQVLKDNKFLH